jgi:hypothetical protein
MSLPACLNHSGTVTGRQQDRVFEALNKFAARTTGGCSIRRSETHPSESWAASLKVTWLPDWARTAAQADFSPLIQPIPSYFDALSGNKVLP